MERKLRFKKILDVLDQDLYERTLALKLAFTSIIAGESIFLLGPPGVAKSLISRRIKQVFQNGKSFEYLMNRFSTPEEIFGPVSISKLKSEDKYERIVENYLPDADVVFLDEIWKASPSIQNSLLTVLNEKIYRNGDKVLKLPMKGLISASNELPEPGVGLEALWDRFVIRCFVHNIQDKQNFMAFLKNQGISENITLAPGLAITNQEYDQWQKEIKQVKLTDEVVNFIVELKDAIKEFNEKDENTSKIYVSDRRWKKISKLIQASAFINGRSETKLEDCGIVKYTIWDELSHIEVIEKIIKNIFKLNSFSDVSDYDDILVAVNRVKSYSESLNKIRLKTIRLNNEDYYVLRKTFKLTLKNNLSNQANLIKVSSAPLVLKRFLSNPTKSLKNFNNEKLELYSNYGSSSSPNVKLIQNVGELNVVCQRRNSNFFLASLDSDFNISVKDSSDTILFNSSFELDSSKVDAELAGLSISDIKDKTVKELKEVERLIKEAKDKVNQLNSEESTNILSFDDTIEKEAQANLYKHEMEIDNLEEQLASIKRNINFNDKK